MKNDSGLTAKKMVIIKILIKYMNIKQKLHFKRCRLAAYVYYAKETIIVYISAAKVLIIQRPTKRKPLKRVKNKADIKIFPYLCTEFFHRFSFSLIDD